MRPSHILPGLLLCAALAPVHAAELGEARVLSHIGQRLSAEVELTMVEDAAKPVQAQLARPDVYRGANVAMPPVLSGLDIAVIRQGGKQFLRLASLKPVESKHLHVYLELVDGGQRAVRLVTLWLTPDPNPAPPPAPAAAPTAAPAAAPVLAAAASPVPAPEPVKAVKPAPVRKPIAPKRRPAPAPVDESAQQPAAHAKPAAPLQHDEKRLAAAHKPDDAPAPACAPVPSAAEMNACAVLGARNDALRQQLGQIEGKVKVLQMAAGVKPAAEAVAKPQAEPQAHPEAKPETHAEAQPEAHPDAHPDTKPEAQSDPKPEAKPDTKPKSAPRIHRKPKAPPPPEEPTPWLAIGGAIAAVLALIGGAVLLRRRRAAAGKALNMSREPEVVVLQQDGDVAGTPAKPSFMSTVKARLIAVRLGKRPAQASRVEPESPAEQVLAQPE